MAVFWVLAHPMSHYILTIEQTTSSLNKEGPS